LRKPFEGFGVSKVVDSDNPNFKTGDLVSGITGWEEYSLIHRTEQLRKIEPDDDIPLSYHVGLLGMILSIVFWDCFSFTRTYIKTYFIFFSIILTMNLFSISHALNFYSVIKFPETFHNLLVRIKMSYDLKSCLRIRLVLIMSLIIDFML
jgi:hypothetical protein